MNRFDDIKTRDDFEKPVAQGGMSIGEGRKKHPEIIDGQAVNGTMYEGCPKSPDGFHYFTAVSNLNSVEHFVCDYCPEEFYD